MNNKAVQIAIRHLPINVDQLITITTENNPLKCQLASKDKLVCKNEWLSLHINLLTLLGNSLNNVNILKNTVALVLQINLFKHGKVRNLKLFSKTKNINKYMKLNTNGIYVGFAGNIKASKGKMDIHFYPNISNNFATKIPSGKIIL